MGEMLSILLLEDDPRDALLIEDKLQSGGVECRLTRVDTRSDFIAALAKKDAYSLILADYSLPGFDGLTALELTRRECQDIPFIFVSGSLGEEVAIEALKIGATDYVLKSKLSRLVPSVVRALRETHERAELSRVERALRRSEAYLAEAQRLSLTGSFGLNPTTGEMTWSLETYRIFSYPADLEVSVRHVTERIHPDDRLLLSRQLERMRGEERVDFESRLLMPDGSIKHLRLVGHPVRVGTSRSEFVGAVMDLTERKRAEDARLGERARIAGDLHDTLLQGMQGLVLLLSAAESQLPKNPDKAHLTLNRALQRAQVALSEGRDAVFELRAAPSRDLESLLRDAAVQLVADQQSQPLLPEAELAVAVHGVPFSLPQAVQYEVNRIALEAVRNAFRHSYARRIDVDIDYNDTSFDLSVQDHGRGMASLANSDQRGRGHWGIIGMRERASRVGGQLWIESRVGQGTRVKFSLPRTGPFPTKQESRVSTQS
jgi:PAS domain S-box-containing protein